MNYHLKFNMVHITADSSIHFMFNERLPDFMKKIWGHLMAMPNMQGNNAPICNKPCKNWHLIKLEITQHE